MIRRALRELVDAEDVASEVRGWGRVGRGTSKVYRLTPWERLNSVTRMAAKNGRVGSNARR